MNFNPLSTTCLSYNSAFRPSSKVCYLSANNPLKKLLVIFWGRNCTFEGEKEQIFTNKKKNNISIKNDLFPQSYAAEKWVRDGCPPNKLIVGLGMYGRHWMVGSSCKINTGANGGGTAGPYTGEKGFWAYYEVNMTNITRPWCHVQIHIEACMFP